MNFSSSGLRAAGLALSALIVLAACQKGPEKLPPACPVIKIVQDLSELTLFKDGLGRDLTDVTLEARVVEFGGFCDTDIDEDDRTGEVDVDMQVLFEATRGPASTEREGSLTYFIAIADTKDNVLVRKTFDFTFEFEGNRNRIGITEELSQNIPLKAGQAGEDFQILIGLQITDGQLRYNRAKRGR